jgi:hypothetical protein
MKAPGSGIDQLHLDDPHGPCEPTIGLAGHGLRRNATLSGPSSCRIGASARAPASGSTTAPQRLYSTATSAAASRAV